MNKKKSAETTSQADALGLDAQDSIEPFMRVSTPGGGDDDFEVMQTDGAERSHGDGLFSSNEILLPGMPDKFRKPVAAIHSIPERRDAALKLTARKLMEAMPLAVQLDLRSRRKEDAQELVRKIREDRATPLFEIRTKELARLAGVSVSNMDRIHETLAEMVGFKFIWNVLGEDGENEYQAVAPFLIRRDKGVGVKNGFTRFAFEPEILLWFLEPKMWANLSWTVMSSIGRSDGPGQEAAFGLYQLIWRYLGTSSKMTPAFDVAEGIDLILGPSRFVKVDSKGAKEVVDYGGFKKRFLQPALKILNAHAALSHTVELKEDKSGRTGRKVVRMRFKFTEKVQGTFDLPLGWPQATMKQLEELGCSEKEIATMSQLYPYEQVAEALKRLPAAEQRVRTKGSRVFSRKAFFGGILGNVARGEVQSAEEDAKLLKEAEQRQQQDDEAKRMEALTAQFEAHKRSLVVDALEALPAEDRERLFQEHLAAEPGARALFKGAERGSGFMVGFCRWLARARPEAYAAWLPAPKDSNFQSWLAWRVSLVG